MIIGISGKMGSGKDTAATHLVERYGYRRVALADKLKEVAYDLFGIAYDAKDDRGRAIYQSLGEKMREIDPAVWINVVMRRIANAPLSSGTNFVISDVRYPNEIDAIHNAGGRVLRVSRPEADRLAYLHAKYGLYTPERALHPSETALSYLDTDEMWIYPLVTRLYAPTIEALYAGLDNFMISLDTVESTTREGSPR